MLIKEPSRFLASIESQIWAIEPVRGRQLLDIIALRAAGEQLDDDDPEIGALARNRPSKVQTGGQVLVLPLFGTISKRFNGFTSGGTSTEKFGAQFAEAMENPDISSIVIQVDSPGGVVDGVDELAGKIFEARGKKRVIAVADALMASAAYWIATAAEETVSTPSGLVGSIGVFTVHTEFSKLEEAAGIKRTIISAGRFKTEGNPFEPLPDEAKEHIADRVEAFYGMFARSVALHRGVSEDSVRGGLGEGLLLHADAALEVGLIDRVATLEQVLGELGVSSGQVSASQAEGPAELVESTEVSTKWAEVPYPIEVDTPIPGKVTITTTGGVPDITVGPTLFEIDQGGADGAAPESTPKSPDTTAPAAREDTVDDDTAPQDGAESTSTKVVAGPDRETERDRATQIAHICALAGVPDRTADFIGGDLTSNEIGEQLRAEVEKGLTRMTAPAVDLTPREVQRYSLTAAIMGVADRGESWDGFERDVSDQIAATLPKEYKSHGGIFIPTRGPQPAYKGSPQSLRRLQGIVAGSQMDGITKTRLLTQLDQMHAALDTGTATAGQELLFTEAGDFIDLLRARMKVAELGATILTGLQGTVAFPKQTGAGTFSWVAEDPGSDVADSDMTLAQVTLASKTGTSSSAYSRQLLNQGVVDVDLLVKNDLALITALGIDLAAIAGTGAGNQPTGILNTGSIGDVDIGANGGAPTYPHMVDLETDVATANADIGALAYLTTPGVRGKLKKTEEFTTSNGRPVWTGGMRGEVNGYRAEVSTQVPSNLTDGTGTALHAIIFGVWSQLLIGTWGAYELVVDPYGKKKQGLIELTSFQQAGIAVRHPGSFSAVQDAAP